MRARIRIKNLTLRTVIGFNDWERVKKQDVVINIEMEFGAQKALETDEVGESLDCKKIKRKIIETVEPSRFRLLESLAARILEAVMEETRVLAATVEVDKPHSLRFADSVSVVVSAQRPPCTRPSFR